MFYPIKTKRRLLIVEPNADKRNLLMTFFSQGYDCDEASSIAEAVERFETEQYSVVLAAIMPPEVSGLELIPILQKMAPDTIPIFMSERESTGNTVKAYRAGAFDVIQMPISLKKVEASVEKALVQHEMRCLRERYKQHLETEVFHRTQELERSLERVETSYRMTLSAVVKALESRDLEAEGHGERMITFSLRLGHELGLDKESMRDLELGTLLHDIGKIGVPDEILKKPGPLNEIEWARIKSHPIHGQNILARIPFLTGANRIVAQHHECWNGSGYPLGIRGEDIDIGARIFAVVDAFDAIISDRIYRKMRSYEEALCEIEKGSGTQFDPLVVEAFKQVPKEDWEILRERSLQDRTDSASFQNIVLELVYAERSFEMVH